MSGDPLALARPPQPALRTPAPGDLAVVQAFLNSADLEAGDDAFRTVADMRRWARTYMPDARVRSMSEQDRRRLIEFREALRDLVEARDGGRVPAATLRRIRSASAGASLAVAPATSGALKLEAQASGAPGVVGRILALLAAADAGGTAARLKICRRDVCRWAFYDVSRNRSGVWCAMSICGNRAKASTFRKRQRRERWLGRTHSSISCVSRDQNSCAASRASATKTRAAASSR